MRVRVQKLGNGLGLPIPPAFAAVTGVDAGSEVDLAVEDGRLVVTPLQRPSYTLADLLAGIDGSNLHGEIGTDGVAGHEAW